jgi:hypothetical protein
MKYLLFACLLCLTYSAKAINEYAIGDNLTVLAANGLTLRDTPNGKKIDLIPCGKKVLVLAENFKKTSHEVEEFKGFKLKGFWVAVKYGSKTGYVFDGFLSKLPAVKQNEMAMYFERNFKVKGKKKDISTCYDDTSHICGTEQLFEDGFFTFKTLDSGNGLVFVFNKITIEEAYLLANIFYKNAEKDSGNRKPEYTYIKNQIEISPPGGVGCSYTVEIKDGKVVLSEYCGC